MPNSLQMAAGNPALAAAVQRSRKLLHRRALVAAAASAVPVPGLDWAVEAALAEGVEFTRELVTEPANVIYPATFVERAHQRLDGTGVRIRVLDRDEMAALGMGALLGVAQGSVREPKLLVMEWNGGARGFITGTAGPCRARPRSCPPHPAHLDGPHRRSPAPNRW